jgi:hypothetical protein
MKHKYYYKDGSVLDYHDYNKELHREDGPAIEWADGDKWWWADGKRHRLDGPAIEYGNNNKSWWVDDKHLTEEQFNNHPKVQNYRFQALLEEVLSER